MRRHHAIFICFLLANLAISIANVYSKDPAGVVNPDVSGEWGAPAEAPPSETEGSPATSGALKDSSASPAESKPQTPRESDQNQLSRLTPIQINSNSNIIAPDTTERPRKGLGSMARSGFSSTDSSDPTGQNSLAKAMSAGWNKATSIGNTLRDMIPKPAADDSGAVSMASPLRFGAGDPLSAALRNKSLDSPGPLSAAGARLNSIPPGLDPATDERRISASIAENANDWQAFNTRAVLREKLGRTSDALADASQAISLNPRAAKNYKTRALILTDQGKLEEAVWDANKALEIYRSDPLQGTARAKASAFAVRALAFGKMGRTEQQLADLKEAAALDASYEDDYRAALHEARARSPLPLPTFGAISLNYYVSLAALLFVLWVGYSLMSRRLETKFETLSRIRNAGIAPAANRPATAPPWEAADAEDAANNFQIIKQIGRGGMGVVFEAIDVTLQRKVALKKMRDEISAEPRERKRFIKEARTVASLKHPNIVEIYSVADRPDGLFLVFEYVDGETLDDLLRRDKRIQPKQAVEILTQVAHALNHAHRLGVVHRDLKPSNIMLSGQTAKVMDFGIARHVQETLSTLSRGEVVGTPVYMAPEQQQGHAYKESDVYSLAICAYEMLSGRVPFPSPAGFREKMSKTFPALKDLVPQLPAAADAVIGRALEPDANHRFHSAAEFAAALQNAIG